MVVRAADHSPPSSAAVMEEYSYNSTHPLGHTGPVTGSLYVCTFLLQQTNTISPYNKHGPYVTEVGGIMKIYLCVCQYELNRPTFVLFGNVTDIAIVCRI